MERDAWVMESQLSGRSSFKTPYFARHPNHMFQQDSARAHIARLTKEVFHQNNVRTLLWPAISPYLNLI